VLPSLALGGAERIVVDWAARVSARYRVHVAVLRDVAVGHRLPEGVRLSRIGSSSGALEAFARTLSTASVVLCHLLTAAQRAGLRRGGAIAVPVIHNTRAGWIDTVDELRSERLLVAVSRACADELCAAGVTGAIHVIRHLPQVPAHDPAARARWRIAWGIPGDALVIGMIGGVKPQKAYPFAVRVLAALKCRAPATRLVIVGGPVGRDGPRAWDALRAQCVRLGLARDVVLAGPVADAARCLPAFDVMLNTSLHEGLSIATLEALASSVPVVASGVGGQGEVGHDALRLVRVDADPAAWADAVIEASRAEWRPPPWTRFPAYRLWTLAQLAAPWAASGHVLFVTANLNAGGAQRSLVNLVTEINAQERVSVAVNGDSTSDALLRELIAAEVDVVRTASSRDAFDHAETLFRLARVRQTGIVVFWNVDAKVKLLVAKLACALPSLRIVDVSPGAYAFEELAATAGFQQFIAFDEAQYRARVDRLVHKFDTRAPGYLRATTIRNGVRAADRLKTRFGLNDSPSIAVSGRIAPTKFLEEIMAAFRIVLATHPRAQLHVYGSAEPRHADYARSIVAQAADLIGRHVFLHGATFDAARVLHRHAVAVVLGVHQGCPNACLEALAAGVPVVANDSGGTREIVIDGKTGWLVGDVAARMVASAVLEVLADPAQARRRAHRGRAHVARRFSIVNMGKEYRRLFRQLRRKGLS
jgi:glycosyltransferase involved in cell wall biosynthesis